MSRYSLKQALYGFTLVEMAVVLVILGLVLSALLLPLQAQREMAFQAQTERTLASAQKALIGYAQSKGRLPCPALDISNGLEQTTDGSTCTQAYGFLPAVTLGVQPVNSNGFVVDGWNNPIRYAVTQNNQGGAATPDFTTANDINTVGMSVLNPNLIVCASATNCPATYITNNAVAVIFSTGPNFPRSAGVDETANLTSSSIFYSREPSVASSANGEFDDMVVWISPFVLYNAMIQAGQLH